jgi:hypothetical protein
MGRENHGRQSLELRSADQLRATCEEYRDLLKDASLSAEARRTDAKHMAFWQQYCAEVARAVSSGEKPTLAKGTYAAVNERAQAEYDQYTDQELDHILENSLTLFLRSLGMIDADVVIPYKQKVRGYSAPEYVDVMENHYRMHVKHLSRLRAKGRGVRAAR